jgi:hypothetical protein
MRRGLAMRLEINVRAIALSARQITNNAFRWTILLMQIRPQVTTRFRQMNLHEL